MLRFGLIFNLVLVLIAHLVQHTYFLIYIIFNAILSVPLASMYLSTVLYLRSGLRLHTRMITPLTNYLSMLLSSRYWLSWGSILMALVWSYLDLSSRCLVM